MTTVYRDMAETRSEIANALNIMTSNAMFRMSYGEWDRILKHLKHLRIGMSDATISQRRRSCKYKMCDHECPEPAVIVRSFYDTYCFSVNMEDPERPGQVERVCVADAHALSRR